MDANGDTAGGSWAGAATSCPPARCGCGPSAGEPTTQQHANANPATPASAPPVNIPLADVQAALIRYLRQADLPIPTIITAPPNGGLVNLPHIFATTDHPPVTLNVTVPLPATLTARPHYTWNYGDGTTGRPFEPGILPADHPNHYLTHTYRTITFTTSRTIPIRRARSQLVGSPPNQRREACRKHCEPRRQ